MDLDELQSVRDRERQTDKLQQLRPTFYADAGQFIQKLRDQRERAADRADDPFDAPQVSRLSDEIDTAEQTVEAIYEKRVGKIVKAASFAAADLPAESDGMTEEEQHLFETLVDDIKTNRQHVLDVLAGEAPDEESPTDTVSTDGADDNLPEEVSAADVMGGAPTAGSKAPDPPESDSGPSTPAVSGAATDTEEQPTERTADDSPIRKDGGTTTESSPGVPRETVRITADVGDIFGVDEREYDLATDDVVVLPEANAKPLLDRDAAERL